MIKVAVVIGGSDPSSGAGVEADIFTLCELGVVPCPVITLVTSQNSLGIKASFPLPENVVESQIKTIFEDFKVSAAKVGALGTYENVKAVISFFRKKRVPLVVDPIFKATSGFSLLENKAKEKIKRLFKIATLVTPNLFEASELTGFPVKDISDMKRAAKAIKEFGSGWVLIKGGHLGGEKCVDILYDGKEIFKFESERIEKEVRGTGCIFASAITANLAKGKDVFSSVKFAKKYVTGKIRKASKIGKGRFQVLPFSREVRG